MADVLPVLDEESQRQFARGIPLRPSLSDAFPPPLPSLAKPQAGQIAPVASSAGLRGVELPDSQQRFTGNMALRPELASKTWLPPASSLPPVTTTTPSPEEQHAAKIRRQLEALENKPSFTAGLWDRTKGATSTLGKIGHVGAGILRGVDIGGEILAPNIARAIPGTGLNRAQNIAQTQAQLGEAEKEAALGAETRLRGAEVPKAEAETAKLKRETDLLGQPKPVEEEWADVPKVFSAQGQPLQYEKHSGQYRWGNVTGAISSEAGPLSAQDAAQRNALWNPILGKAKSPVTSPFREGMSPDLVKGVETALNQATGREQGQVHIDISEANLSDKLRKESESDAQAATQGRMNLYMQDGYNDAIKAWHQKTSTAQYGKDNVLITNLLNQEQTGNGALSGGVAGNMAVGSLIGGPTGAAVGGALGVFTNAINGPANAILDSMKRQGLSNEGYAAMQAYLNALPARMSWELTTGGVKASTMRFGELLRKVIATVPAPNTPKSAWDDSFQRYFKPMTTATERKEQTFRLPKDYVVPTKEEFIPSGVTGASGGEAPEGTRIQVGDKVQVKRGGKWVDE